VVILRRKRNEVEGRLDLVGRDIPDGAYGVTFEDGLWQGTGHHQEGNRGPKPTAHDAAVVFLQELLANGPVSAVVVADTAEGHPLSLGSVSNVAMATPRALVYKMFFPSISTCETPPSGQRLAWARPGRFGGAGVAAMAASSAAAAASCGRGTTAAGTAGGDGAVTVVPVAGTTRAASDALAGGGVVTRTRLA
jgi:hypothetical protein